MARLLLRLAVLGVVGAAACVPADEGLSLGSASFTIVASPKTLGGFTSSDFTCRTIALECPPGAQEPAPWTVAIERALLSFKTMTIGKVGEADRCSYRGRGATNDTVFDARFGIVQTFNGVEQGECPDVGIVLGPPAEGTDVGPGATVADLLDLRGGVPAHALIEATARGAKKTLRVSLRFDTARTAAKFGGCQAGRAGIQIASAERTEATVAFAADMLFRDAFSRTAAIFLEPFARADEEGNDDGVVTMNELDALTLEKAALQTRSKLYNLPSGTRRGSLGELVRELFRFAIAFRGFGQCIGNAPGTE